jgi:hypothetical protein
VGPFHHGMPRPRVANRGDGLQIWREAANVLYKQTWEADIGWSSSLRANNSSSQKTACYEIFYGAYADPREHGNETSGSINVANFLISRVTVSF